MAASVWTTSEAGGNYDIHYAKDTENIFRPDILKSLERTITDMDNELRELSLDIHGSSPVE